MKNPTVKKKSDSDLITMRLPQKKQSLAAQKYRKQLLALRHRTQKSGAKKVTSVHSTQR